MDVKFSPSLQGKDGDCVFENKAFRRVFGPKKEIDRRLKEII
jgi:hypothetical protein